MLTIVMRKMMSSKWMLACMLLGAVITVALLSSIPVYTGGIMQRMLIRDLENSQNDSGNYPGGYLIQSQSYMSVSPQESIDAYNGFDEKISGIIYKTVPLPLITESKYISSSMLNLHIPEINKDVTVYAAAFSGIEEHIELLHGKLPAPVPNNGVYEVMVSEEAMKVLNLVLGNTYSIEKYKLMKSKDSKDTQSFNIKVTGIYTYKDVSDPYWYRGIETLNQTVLMDFGLLTGTFLVKEGIEINQARWFSAFDYHKIKVENLDSLLHVLNTHIKWLDTKKSNLYYNIPALKIIRNYYEREKQLTTTLLVLQIPILIMLAFYTFMIAKLKIDFESNEIAVLKSRGGSSLQVFMVYLAESLFIGIAALLAGPPLGYLLCRILGSSNGFLEFIQRAALPLELKPEAYLYSIIAVIFISVSMLIPAYKASKTSIVLYKQSKSRENPSVFWKKYFIDVILLAIAFYGFYGYKNRQKVLFVSGVKGTDLTIDPLLFVISALFILGCGLLFLRLFPYIVQLIFSIGKNKWGPVMYASFIQVGRTAGQEQFVILFLILTMSIGIFNSNSARTLNMNMEEKIRYGNGADIVVEGVWESNQPTAMELLGGVRTPPLLYFEPPYEPYTKLEGAESVTKVLRRIVTVSAGSAYIDKVPLMGIIPSEFGRTAWFRSDLLPYHWYQYLNLMTDSPAAVLVSSAYKQKYNLNEGDPISASWGDGMYLNGIIYAFIDYWPSLNPNLNNEKPSDQFFIVANLNYIQDNNIVEPYQVWIKKKHGAASNDIYASMEKNHIELSNRKDTTEELVKRKNDPMLQGTNGSLTLGFIVTIIISTIGFLIYWIMSIKKRVLQFGIFRAMGLSYLKITGMLVMEQILITGSSIAAGILTGSLASRIFIPMLQLVYGAQQQVPPFRVVSEQADYIRLCFIVGVMLLTVFIILRRIVVKINMSQALKLGED